MHKNITGNASSIRLHLRDDRIALEVPSDGSPTLLEAGSLHGILDCLRHEPATAAELEAAIAVIEDQLMPAVRQLPPHRRLATSAPEVRRIAEAAGLGNLPNLRLTIETVESLFRNLADMAYGAPAARLGMPSDRAFAATLLLLRELLHHGGFDSVMIV